MEVECLRLSPCVIRVWFGFGEGGVWCGSVYSIQGSTDQNRRQNLYWGVSTSRALSLDIIRNLAPGGEDD